MNTNTTPPTSSSALLDKAASASLGLTRHLATPSPLPNPSSPKQPSKVVGFYGSLQDLFNTPLAPAEEILHGGRRGQISQLASVTNMGKTTLLLNVVVQAAAGEAFLPLLPRPERPLRSLILDMESTGKELQDDLLLMTKNIQNKQDVLKNIIPIVDAEIDDEILDLSNERHFQYVLEKAKSANVDLIVVDTCSSAFDVEDENNNAEVKRRILLPLKHLAREANCHVVYAHHIGKVSEDPTRRNDPAYHGRGASAFGALSRSVYILAPDRTLGVGHVTLTCAKSKGPRFSETLLSLDTKTRWFQADTNSSIPRAEAPTMDEIVAFVTNKGEVSTNDVYDHFSGRATERTLDDRLKQGRIRGLISKQNKQAPWRACTNPQTAAYIENTDCGLIQ